MAADTLDITSEFKARRKSNFTWICPLFPLPKIVWVLMASSREARKAEYIVTQNKKL